MKEVVLYDSVLNILLVEDDEDDFVMTRDLLLEIDGLRFDLDWASTFKDGLTKIMQKAHDVYLLDYRLGERTGLDLLREGYAIGCEAPFIILTGQGDHEIDVQAMEAGAADFLVKGQFNTLLLDRSIRYSIAQSRAERRLAYLAHYDDLTKLPNRILFMDRLRQALALSKRENFLIGLLFLDLDRFKVINDTLGHSTGDLLLQQVAGRLKNCVRESDTVARLGGDEFVVLLSAIAQAENASLLAQGIVDALTSPFFLDGQEVFTSPSIGIALSPIDGKDAENLVKKADVAMYQAKDRGGNNYQYFSKSMNKRTHERLNFEIRLRRALKREEFMLYYQPQFAVNSDKLVGMEALLRWRISEDEIALPCQFIPLLEETGIINAVGEWVLYTACTQNRLWQQAGLPSLRMAVNLSSRQLNQSNIVDVVARVLAGTGLDAAWLELELTENTMMKNLQENMETIYQLKNLGLQLAIDDFGTGYSSLSSLSKIPVDRLKIDCSFIWNIGKNSVDEKIIQAVIALAHSLNLVTVAEGVETPEQLSFLRKHNCHEVQGFYCGKPTPAEEFMQFFDQA